MDPADDFCEGSLDALIEHGASGPTEDSRDAEPASEAGGMDPLAAGCTDLGSDVGSGWGVAELARRPEILFSDSARDSCSLWRRDGVLEAFAAGASGSALSSLIGTSVSSGAWDSSSASAVGCRLYIVSY